MTLDSLREQLQASLGKTYALERELGGGGMSRVFLATESRLGRPVVIKVLEPELAEGLIVERFDREILLAAKLQHPHIVPVLAAGETNGLPYYAMPFVEGMSLRVKLASSGALPIPEAVAILRDVAKALAFAHEHAVVHRDIKPENVLLAGGSAMVTDFGIAKAISASRTQPDGPALTAAGNSLGTPAYMAPEQVSGDPVDHRADIYAFGGLAYELLSGRHVFAGRTTAQQFMVAHLAEQPPPLTLARPDVPPSLATLVMRCLEKRPEDRPQSAAEVLQALEGIGTPRAGASASSFTDARRRGTRRAMIGGGVLVVLAGVLALVMWRPRTSTSPAAKSIAVLPFTTLGGANQDEPFAEGITVEITDALGKLPGLSVKAASLAKAAARKGLDVRRTGEELGVDALLQGSLQRAGTRVRINAQLVSTANGSLQWTGKYDEDFKDVFAVQDAIARAIANELRVRLSGEQQTQLVRVATASTEAHALFLQGLYLWDRRTYRNIKQAINFFERAIAIDPRYAQAHAGLAMAYAILPTYADIDNAEAFTNAERIAGRALALDSASVEAHAALGFAYLGSYRNASAEREFRRAIQLDSSFATAHHWLSMVLARRERFDEAIAAGRRARDLDPQSRVIQSTYAATLLQARRLADAERETRSLISFDSSFANAYRNLTLILLAQGRPAEAAAAAKRSLDESGEGISWHRALLATAYVASGRRAEGRSILDDLLDRARRGEHVSAAGVAVLYANLGEREKAIEWLARAVDQYAAFYYYSRGPIMDRLRADPRGAALLAHVEGPND